MTDRFAYLLMTIVSCGMGPAIAFCLDTPMIWSIVFGVGFWLLCFGLYKYLEG